MLIRVALKSLLNRKFSVFLMVFAMSLGMTSLLATRILSDELERGFSSSVSGTDLIVAARSHPVQAILYSVFRLGSATQSISWPRYQEVVGDSRVAWSFPIALGDSHQGYPVVGTSEAYFTHFKYSNKRSLIFTQGRGFKQTHDAVLGAAIARELGYQLGDKLYLSHGVGKSFFQHNESYFVVSGILKATGTPVDHSVHVHHKALEALHLPQWKYKLNKVSLDELPNPRVISSVFVGLKSRFMVFKVQGDINSAHKEPLTAVIPGVALSELWRIMSLAENLLTVLTWMMLLVSLVGMAAMLQATVVGRLPEIALFRMMGARPWKILCLIELEVVCLVVLAWLMAIGLTLGSQYTLQPFLADRLGIAIDVGLPLEQTAMFAGISVVMAILVGIFPAMSVYRVALNRQLFHGG